jgi:preprotein translocase subunit SecA
MMKSQNLESIIHGFVEDLVEEMYAPLEKQGKDEIDPETAEMFKKRLNEVFALERVLDLTNIVSEEEVKQGITSILEDLKVKTGEHFQEILRFFLLESLDRYWKEHLLNMDHLKEGIGLRGYGQKDPRHEYKREGFEYFQELLFLIKESTLKSLCHIRVQDVSEENLQHQEQQNIQLSGGESAQESQQTYKRQQPKVGRNDPCPCGSGLKYKRCCGR